MRPHFVSCKRTIDIRYNNKTIENVNYLSILGVTFDNKNSFKYHYKSLKINLAARLDVVD